MERWWGIRHIRYCRLAWKLDAHVARCRSAGLGFITSEADESYLLDVWEGRA